MKSSYKINALSNNLLIEIDPNEDLNLALPRPLNVIDLAEQTSLSIDTKKNTIFRSNRVHPIQLKFDKNKTPNKRLIFCIIFLIIIIISLVFIIILIEINVNNKNSTTTIETTFQTNSYLSTSTSEQFKCYSSTFSSRENTSTIETCNNSYSCLMSKTIIKSNESLSYLSGGCNKYRFNFNVISINLHQVFMLKICYDSLCNTETVSYESFQNDPDCQNKTAPISSLPDLDNLTGGVEQCYHCYYCLFDDFNNSTQIQNCPSTKLNSCQVNFWKKFY